MKNLKNDNRTSQNESLSQKTNQDYNKQKPLLKSQVNNNKLSEDDEEPKKRKDITAKGGKNLNPGNTKKAKVRN
jgi:hypothetical protein